jgi:hypothetical protein
MICLRKQALGFPLGYFALLGFLAGCSTPASPGTGNITSAPPGTGNITSGLLSKDGGSPAAAGGPGVRVLMDQENMEGANAIKSGETIKIRGECFG